MSTNEEVIMTVKLWGVDRLHLRFDYHSKSIHSLFSAFCSKCGLFSLKRTHIQVFNNRMHDARM